MNYVTLRESAFSLVLFPLCGLENGCEKEDPPAFFFVRPAGVLEVLCATYTHWVAVKR